jgi:hypothetical protein
MANRFSVPFRNQAAELWLRSKAVSDQRLFVNDHRVGFALVLRKFA